MIRILPMTEETVPAVAALEKVCFSTPWSERSIRGELESGCALWLTAEEDGSFLGYLGLEYGPDGADIMNIAVSPEARSRGAARALMEAGIERLKALDLQWLTLEVRPSNAPALALYRAFGFREVGRRKNYYRCPTEDALLMTLFFKEEMPNADNGN